jgi:hypothetical protein
MSDPTTEGVCVSGHAFLRKLWGDCWPNLGGLLGANGLFLLWCVPTAVAVLLQLRWLALAVCPVTVGPALVGLFVYAANLALERPASWWRDSLGGFWAGFGGGVLWAAAMITAWAASRLALTQALDDAMSVGAVALWSAQMALCLVLSVTGAYTFSLIALYRQGTKAAIRNAALLTLAYPMSALGLVGAGVLTGLLSQLLCWGPLIILPALCAVLAVNTTLLLIQRHHTGRDRSLSMGSRDIP